MNIFKERMILITDVFPKLRTPKSLVKQISKKSPFRGPLRNQHVRGRKLKSEPHHLYHIYWSLWTQLSWKKCLLVICKDLRIFLNILTGDDKYFLVNRDNLRQPIQMQLSQKQKTSSEFVSVFFKFIIKFEHFRIEENPHRSCISEITDSEKRG